MRKSKTCLNCGNYHRRRGNHCCPECGFNFGLRVARQLNTKEGIYYERWKQRWEAATGLKMKGEK